MASSNGGTTPVGAQQHVPAAPDSTIAPQHRLPVNSAGPMTLTAHARTAAVTGPTAWENGRDQAFIPSGLPPLHGTTAADVHPCTPGAGDCP